MNEINQLQASPVGALVAIVGLAAVLAYWVWSVVRWAIPRLR